MNKFLLLLLFPIVGFSQQIPQQKVVHKPVPVVRNPNLIKSVGKNLPIDIYRTLIDSTTDLDCTFLNSGAGSMSVNGKNVRYFSQFVENKPSEKWLKKPKDGFIMWQIRGREFLSGDYYVGGKDSSYIIFTKGDTEYVNRLSDSGAEFLMKTKK